MQLMVLTTLMDGEGHPGEWKNVKVELNKGSFPS